MNNTQYKVSGQVFNFNGEPIMGQEVLAADVDLRGAAIYRTVASVRELEANGGFEILGTAQTEASGYYEIAFKDKMYQRNELGLADVVTFAVDNDAITARSKLATQKDYTGNELIHWDIQLPDAAKRGISEYARLIAVLAPFVKENGLQLFQLSASVDQINFLAAETNQDQAHTLLAVQADKLRSDLPKAVLSSELFYGIGRQNITLSWVSLLQKTESNLLAAIKRSEDDNIIAPQDARTVDGFLKAIMAASIEHSVNAPEIADFYKTVGFAVKNTNLQRTFAQAYLQFNGKPEDFWQSLAQKPDFSPGDIQALQLTNQLSILTGQHTPLIEELQVKREIKNLPDLISYDGNKWNTIITTTGVPDAVPGNTPEEKANNYIAGIQNTLNAAYPTQKIALMVQTDKQFPIKDANVKEKVSAFFDKAQGFDISVSRLSDPKFDKTIQEVSGDMDGMYDKVLQQLQIIQRIYQISPTPEVMKTLINQDYTSAYAISALSQNLFISTEAEALGGADVAFSVYNRARHQVMRAQHTLLKVQDTQDQATPAKVITRQQQQAISDYLSTLSKSTS